MTDILHLPLMRKFFAAIGFCYLSTPMFCELDLDDENVGFQDFVIVHELLHLKVPNHGRLGVSAIAKTTGLKRQSVYRIQAEPEKQMAALRAWYPSEFIKQTSH